jgi:Mn-dependent DtxR family transcriptional regulator
MAKRTGGRRRAEPAKYTPSASQEDYLETIYHLEKQQDVVLVSDIAERLRVQRPPATRAVQALKRKGFVAHEARGDVSLTALGRSAAEALAHRHADLYYLLSAVLGVPPDVAESDTCQMEHGISPLTAQRLHEFLEHYRALDESVREKLRAGKISAAFRHLPEGRIPGWRA